MGSLYRLKQFWQATTAGPLPDALLAEVCSVLEPTQLALFRQFGHGDQWHSVRVYRLLQEEGQSDPDLLTAALLHDVGKVRVSLTPWERTLVVITEKLWPSRAEAWGSGEPRGWKRPFVVRSQHPAWGAEMAAEAGASAMTVALIRHHQDPALVHGSPQLRALLDHLQWADDQS